MTSDQMAKALDGWATERLGRLTAEARETCEAVVSAHNALIATHKAGGPAVDTAWSSAYDRFQEALHDVDNVLTEFKTLFQVNKIVDELKSRPRLDA